MTDAGMLAAIKADLEIIKGKLLRWETANAETYLRLSSIDRRLDDIDARLTALAREKPDQIDGISKPEVER